jgi:hypothetical protein
MRRFWSGDSVYVALIWRSFANPPSTIPAGDAYRECRTRGGSDPSPRGSAGWLPERHERRTNVTAQDGVAAEEVDDREQLKVPPQRECCVRRAFPRRQWIPPVDGGCLGARYGRASTLRERRSGNHGAALAHHVGRARGATRGGDVRRKNAALEHAPERESGDMVLPERRVHHERRRPT